MQSLHPVLPLLSALLLLPVTVTATATAQDAGWFTDFHAARELATRQNVTLLVHVYGPHCAPCLRMEREVFTVPRIQTALTRGIVAVKLNGQENFALISKLGVKGYPADVIFKPGFERVVRQRPFTADEYLALLESIATPVSAPPAKPEQSKATSGTRREDNRRAPVQAPPPPANPRRLTDSATNSLNTSLIGLDGFCPVTLQQRRVLKPGVPGFAAEHEGVRYQFASGELRDVFQANPTLYAPAVQGCDPITLAREQRAVPGSVRYGTWYAGKLFLFQSDANRQTFKASPAVWTRIQSATNPPARARR
jgi:YHS domain-containing protein/thiol-disulfide isomerase/thioredoxin